MFGKPMLMMILMMMMTIIMIIIITIILVFLWLVVGYLLPTCLLTIIALLTVWPRSLSQLSLWGNCNRVAMGQLSQGSGLSGNAVRVAAALFKTLMSESSFGSVYSHMGRDPRDSRWLWLWHPHGRVVPEKCALSRGSGVLGRHPRDSCRCWSPHVEKVCTVTQIRLGEGGGGGYHWGPGSYMIPVRPSPPPPFPPPNGSPLPVLWWVASPLPVVWCGPGVGLLGVVSLLPACGMVWVRVVLRWFPPAFLGLLGVFGILIPTMIMMMMMMGTM